MRSESLSSSSSRPLPLLELVDRRRRACRRTCGPGRRARPGAPAPAQFAAAVGVESAEVAGQLGREVGDGEGCLGHRLGDPSQLRVVVGDAFERAPGGIRRGRPRRGRRRGRRRRAARGPRPPPAAGLRGWSAARRARPVPRLRPAAERRPRSRRWRPQLVRLARAPVALGDEDVELRCAACQRRKTLLVVGQHAGNSDPAKRSSASRCAAATRNRIWSDCPCTTTRWLADLAEHADRGARPPTTARLRLGGDGARQDELGAAGSPTRRVHRRRRGPARRPRRRRRPPAAPRPRLSVRRARTAPSCPHDRRAAARAP